MKVYKPSSYVNMYLWASLSSVNYNLVSSFEERRRQGGIWGGRRVERGEIRGEMIVFNSGNF